MQFWGCGTSFANCFKVDSSKNKQTDKVWKWEEGKKMIFLTKKGHSIIEMRVKEKVHWIYEDLGYICTVRLSRFTWLIVIITDLR